MRLLFVKPGLAWPRTSGHDVYCYHMMKALAGLGAEVALATIAELHPRAVEGFQPVFCGRLASDLPPGARPESRLSWLQERFRSFWGVSTAHIESVRALAKELRPDVVIAFGLPSLPFLAGVDDAVRVWAMADEWVYHHLSQVRLFAASSWPHVKPAMIKGVYERVYAPLVDRAWAVSDTDRWAARWFAGIRVTDLLPNGVDTDFYHPLDEPVTPRSAIFWGRLDFEPNVDALTWFGRHVWPAVLRDAPDARFTIIGYAPTKAVERLTELPNVSLRPNVDDLRAAVCQHALVALPMISGGGIKNKLLEGAAMGRPIVCTPRACLDLRSGGRLPVVMTAQPQAFARAMVALWGDEARRSDLGREARRWVSEYYSWTTPARNALTAFEQAVAARTMPQGVTSQPV